MVIRHSRVSARHKDRIKIGQNKKWRLVEGWEVGLQLFPLSVPVAGAVVQVSNQGRESYAVRVTEDYMEQDSSIWTWEINSQCMW